MKEDYYQKRGIKSYTVYTTTYHGILVKDYGFHAMIKALRKQFPMFYFKHDAPLQATRQTVTRSSHKIKIHIKKYLMKKPTRLLAVYDLMDSKWYFIDEKVDKYVDIKKLLKMLKEEKMNKIKMILSKDEDITNET